MTYYEFVAKLINIYITNPSKDEIILDWLGNRFHLTREEVIKLLQQNKYKGE